MVSCLWLFRVHTSAASWTSHFTGGSNGGCNIGPSVERGELILEQPIFTAASREWLWIPGPLARDERNQNSSRTMRRALLLQKQVRGINFSHRRRQSTDFMGLFSLEAEEHKMASAGPSWALAGAGAWVELKAIYHMSKYLKIKSNPISYYIFW